MTTTSTSDPRPRVLVDVEHTLRASNQLAELPETVWEHLTVADIVEGVFQSLGYTIHAHWLFTIDTTMHTWLLQNPTGEWFLFDIDGATPHGLNAPIPKRIWAIYGSMRTTFEVVRGVDPGALYLDIIAIGDASNCPSWVAAVDWLETHTGLDTEAMHLLAALAGRNIWPFPPTRPHTVTTHELVAGNPLQDWLPASR